MRDKIDAEKDAIFAIIITFNGLHVCGNWLDDAHCSLLQWNMTAKLSLLCYSQWTFSISNPRSKAPHSDLICIVRVKK